MWAEKRELESAIGKDRKEFLEKMGRKEEWKKAKLWRLEELGQKNYFQEGMEVPIEVVSRFRLGIENLSSKYWREEKQKSVECGKEETLRHIFESCK